MIEVSIFILFCYFVLYFLSIKLKNNWIVDVFWWLWFVIIAWYTLLVDWTFDFGQILLTLIITIWWVWLATYVFSKIRKSKWEDFRYNNFRKLWKWFYTRSFFQVYLLQFCLMMLIASPIWVVNLYWWESIYYLIWWIIAIIWFAYEWIANYQLYTFKSQKTNSNIITTWLYKYSRFPQYFGELLFWFWLWVMGIATSFLSMLGFFILFLLLNFVSWVPLIEKKYQDNLEYQKYKKTTRTKIIPWFPK